jgi:hypothetical protein
MQFEKDIPYDSTSAEPFFERMGSVDELQQCRQIIDSLQGRVKNLEKINLDLEYRLEDSAKQCMEVEKQCVLVDQKWKAKMIENEKDIETWKRSFEAQQMKTDRLREHLSRTEKELYSILQRKYELMRGPGRGGPAGGGPGSGQGSNGSGGSSGNIGTIGSNNFSGNRRDMRSSIRNDSKAEEMGSAMFPEDTFTGAHDPQEIRQRRMMVSLNDFLNL